MHNSHRKILQNLPVIEAAILSHCTEPGGTVYVHIYHDDWCGHNRGGRCNCDPDLKLEMIPKEAHQ